MKNKDKNQIKLSRDLTVVILGHNLGSFDFADRTITLEAGKIAAQTAALDRAAPGDTRNITERLDRLRAKVRSGDPDNIPGDADVSRLADEPGGPRAARSP